MRESLSPARLRWLGLLGSALMAASAHLAGSATDRGPGWAVGVGLWLVGAGGLAAVWWRLRTVAAPGWLLGTGALWAVPLLLAPPLGSSDVYAYACQGEIVRAGLDPYAVGPDALPCRWLDWVAPSWRDTPAPYGSLWLLVEGVAASVSAGSLPLAVTVLRLVAIVGVLLAAAAGARLARHCGGNPARVVWLGAIGPLPLVHVVSGAHNDALLAGLVVLGLLAAAELRTVVGRLALAGVAFGAAASVKATALVAVPFALAVVPWARTGRRRVAAGAVLTGATLGTVLLLAGVTGHGLGFVRSWPATAGSVQWSSIPTGVGMAVGYGLRAAGRPEAFGGAVEVARLLGLAALGAVLLLAWRRALRGGVAVAVPAAGVALLATALLGPVFYAWYALAGVAVLAAAAPRGRLGTLLDAGSAGLVFLTLPDSLGLVTKTKVPGALLDLALVGWLLTRWAGRRPAGPARMPAGRSRELARRSPLVSGPARMLVRRSRTVLGRSGELVGRSRRLLGRVDAWRRRRVRAVLRQRRSPV
ncbi:polyprenol phosphomannose-dependent alpha 1,6 mannosyltransferase MptB [Plantactinospora sp. KLBMP9567]|uniref:polyprenol phosphomannose-dependent alpha 1,6 mannosyltransferase MptB n=1 Tax=Plantactinospora sp. KLBMP9567 TaxID=3085900 RepID=UPI0029816D55|nr:polyprenol phosphomannose-dependent alpha 1,6 mannosyltransferase MptB [Plantactinospora sp. KLBMP9567]MDW5322501.1 polyprenol phosphomannose-dependent alpha 1,6 mannosyltransferase MptB [Plantactinospora sp. KLBMP9567]